MKGNKISVKIDATPEMIYAALTTPHGIHSWFSEKGAIGSNIGDTHDVNYIMKGNPKSMVLEIHGLTQNEFVAWRCIEHEFKAYIDSMISFTIGSNGELEFVHNHFNEEFLEEELEVHNRKIWNYLVMNLKNFCEGKEAHPW